MRNLYSIFLALGLIFITFPSYSMDHHSMHDMSNISGIQLLIESEPVLTANKTVTIRFKLLNDNKMLTLNDLKEVHTQKIHLLVIDPTLSDYHHVHPTLDNKAQDFVFTFTPKHNSSYRIWADITPLATNKQEFLIADIGTPSKDKIVIEKNEKLNADSGAYHFVLKLDGEPKAGQEVIATIAVTKDGKPFAELEPIMGAFAHVVGFGEDYNSILHIHPMGPAPESSTDRGGPELMFHIAFKNPGFVKFFAQVRINGKDLYVPFCVVVK